MDINLLVSDSNRPTIICFHTNYSGSFHLMQPLFKDLMEDYRDLMDLVFVEKDNEIYIENLDNLEDYAILILVWNNKIFFRHDGLISREELYANIDKMFLEIKEYGKQSIKSK